MEYSEKVLAGTGEVEMDLNIVSEEAGKLYTELQVSRPLHYFWIPLHLSHPAALSNRLSSRLTAREPWSQWYPYLCGSWRGWPATKPSWGTRRWRWSGRGLSENICWRGTRQKELSGKNVKRWEAVALKIGCHKELFSLIDILLFL